MLKRIDAFTCFLADGRICITTTPPKRALRGLCSWKKSMLFAGSDRGANAPRSC